MASFADQIHHSPVSLAHLDVVQLQANQFRPAKSTPEQHSQHGVIALLAHAVAIGMFEHFRTLLHAQPVAGAESELLDSSDSADARSQLGAQQSGIGGFVSQTAHGCELLVDGVGGEMPRFQVHTIAHDNDAIERQTGLGTIPGDEFIDGMSIAALRLR